MQTTLGYLKLLEDASWWTTWTRHRGHARPGGQHRHGGQPEHGESAEGIWLLEVSIRYFRMENVVLEGMVDMVDKMDIVDNMEIGAIVSTWTLQTKTN